MADIQLLLEAERRGILPAEKAGLLTEARRRGLIPSLEPVAQPEPERVFTQSEVLERARLQDDLNRNLAAADQAGESLQREEAIAGVARPLLAGLTIPADAVLGIPRLATNLSVLGINKVFGTDLPQAGQLTSGRLAPQTRGERYAAAATSGLASALTGVGVGQQLANSAGPVAQRVGQVLAANPGAQGVAGVSGNSAGEFAADAGGGPITQTLASIGGSLVPGIGLSLANKAASGLTRTPEAQRLLDAGVDLTPGQLNPKGIYNQLEENVQSLPLVGPAIRNARDNARAGFQRAAVQEGAAPGTTVKQADPATMLDEAYQSFQPLYDQAKGFPVRPVIVNRGANTRLDTAIRGAVNSRSIFATADQRKDVLKFVNGELTRGLRTSDDLLRIRSEVRTQARQRLSRGDADSADLLRSVDDVLTRALESQLPARPLQALRTADAQYGKYKTVENAVARAKDRELGFTPNELSESVFQQVGRGAGVGSYARGGGGPLRELASDGRKVLDARAPPTGQRLAVLAPGAALAAVNPAAGVAFNSALAGGVLTLTATQTGRKIAAGTTGVQQALKRQLAAQNINVPLVYKQALANSVTQQASDQLARVTPARELVFLDPESTPESVALAKAAISRSDPQSYRSMVREFLSDSYVNPNSVAQDPKRIRAVLPADAPDALTELVRATQDLSKSAPADAKGAISDALRQRSIGNIQFLLSPGKVDPQTTGAAIDALTDVLLDPEKRLKLRQATRIKDPEKQLLILGGLFNPETAQAAVQ